MEKIISEQEVINTYNKRQQEQCRLYYEYKKIKQENPFFGYKRIAKLLNQPYGKTRWWHCNKHTPTPIQTVEWLKEKGLIPLNIESPNLSLISKILGATFADGGIFENLNGIFLSSSELDAVKEFGEDLKKVFGKDIEQNSRIIEAGEYGHSWCYQNTNRGIIRFFQACGAPIGDKSQIKLEVPNWMNNMPKNIKDEFFGSLFGGELNVPKIHPENNRLETLSLGITGKDELAENRMNFLRKVANYLNNLTIKTGKISINDHKKFNRKGELTKIYRLLISTEFENVTNFMTLVKINYCKYKKVKLAETMNKFSEIKRQRFNDLLQIGYSEFSALKLLKISPVVLEIINNNEDYHEVYSF